MAAAASSTGTDQQALINQLQAGLSGLFGSGGTFTSAVGGQTAAITTLAQAQAAGFTSVAAAQAAQTSQLQQNLAAVQAAILQAQQSGDTATASALQAQSTSLQAALTAQSGGITSGFQSLIANLGSGFQALTSGITTSQTQSAAQGQAVIGQLQTTQAALSALFGNVTSTQATQLGYESATACFAGNGNVSSTCLEANYPRDRVIPDKAGDDANVITQLKSKYSTCWNATNQTFDPHCVGLMMVTGGTPQQTIPGG
jgi:hypothetical protein